MNNNMAAIFDQDTAEDRLERIRQTAIADWENTNNWGGINRKEACRVGMRAVIAARELNGSQGVAIHQRRLICKCPPNDQFCICNTNWKDFPADYRAKYEQDDMADGSAEWRTVYTLSQPIEPQGAVVDEAMGEDEREVLGQLVRLEWMDWAREQPVCKPSWLVPWEELSEPDREVDRRIGERIAHAVRSRSRLGSPGDSEHVRRLIGKLDQWKYCMSYNESYFGEPAGLVKQVTAELAHVVDPIYPQIPQPVEPLDGELQLWAAIDAAIDAEGRG